MSRIRNTSIIEELHEAWARENGYRPKGASVKPEAASCKLQAEDASTKLQATSSNNSEISSQLREGHGP